jgi:hypothetical protein
MYGMYTFCRNIRNMPYDFKLQPSLNGIILGRLVRGSRLEWILATGLEQHYVARPPLPPTTEQNLRLVCWIEMTAD